MADIWNPGYAHLLSDPKSATTQKSTQANPYCGIAITATDKTIPLSTHTFSKTNSTQSHFLIPFRFSVYCADWEKSSGFRIGVFDPNDTTKTPIMSLDADNLDLAPGFHDFALNFRYNISSSYAYYSVTVDIDGKATTTTYPNKQPAAFYNYQYAVTFPPSNKGMFLISNLKMTTVNLFGTTQPPVWSSLERIVSLYHAFDVDGHDGWELNDDGLYTTNEPVKTLTAIIDTNSARRICGNAAKINTMIHFYHSFYRTGNNLTRVTITADDVAIETHTATTTNQAFFITWEPAAAYKTLEALQGKKMTWTSKA